MQQIILKSNTLILNTHAYTSTVNNHTPFTSSRNERDERDMPGDQGAGQWREVAERGSRITQRLWEDLGAHNKNEI